MRYARSFLAIVIIGLFITAICLIPTRTYAVSGLSVSPPLQEVTLGPGLVQASINVTLKNTTKTPVNASYKLVDLKALGQYGGSTLDKAGLPDTYDLANWMTLPGGNTQTISGNQTVTIKINIDNRSDLTPGGHYGALEITTSPEGAADRSISLNQQIISLIFVKKLGGETYGLDLESFAPNSRARLPDSVTLHFKSTGNVHVIPRGYIEVTDRKGRLISKGIINQDSSLILPGSSRQFVTIMQPVSNARPGGEYIITVYYRYDGQAKFSSKSLTFNQSLASGHTIALLIIGSMTALLTIFSWIFRRKKNKAKNTHGAAHN